MQKEIDRMKVEICRQQMYTEEIWSKGAKCSAQNKTLRETVKQAETALSSVVVQQEKFEVIIDELNEKNAYHQKKLQGLDGVLTTTTAELAKDKAALKKLTMEHEDLVEVKDWLKKENQKIPEMEKEIKDLNQFKEHH